MLRTSPPCRRTKDRKRGVVAALDEAAQQVGIRQVLGVLGHEHTAQVPENEIELTARHEGCSFAERTSHSFF
jgi:hypothetical protein